MNTVVPTDYLSRNNFDLVRLLAAGQVLLVHGIEHMRVDMLRPLVQVLKCFPGVPAFFFISGYLITAAWERNPDLRVFYLNRFFRICPGLWACVLASATVVVVAAACLHRSLPTPQFVVWTLGQGSVLQAWNPDWLRWFGVGVVNGSLWTIPVEVCFYITVPLLYWLHKRRIVKLHYCLVTIAIGSFAILYLALGTHVDSPAALLIQRMVRISPIPWIGMFSLGALAQRHIRILYPLVAGRFALLFALFAVTAFIGAKLQTPVLFGAGNGIGFLNYLTLCMMILAAAYSCRNLSIRMLGKNDLSYGIYIYHMPTLNVIVEYGIRGVVGLALDLGMTFMLAGTSWWLVERPALRRRKKSLYVR